MGLNVNLMQAYNLKDKKIKCKKCGGIIEFDIRDYDIEDWCDDKAKKIMYGECKKCETEYIAELNVKSFIDNIKEDK